ncbi:MAG: GrdX family protein [Firmicutes bacterium]|nr:GrdX family protein [Bacillota bacterium]MDD4336887.1 GrdX family protein [Bacillota bacterium]
MAITDRRCRMITNNPLIAAKWPRSAEWVCGGAGDVLSCVRDHVHLGHRLLSHPLAGGTRPNESPYRSVFITNCPISTAVDFDSLRIIEGSMAVMKGFGASRFRPIPPHVDYDYQLIDCALMESAMESLQDVAWGGVVDGHEAWTLHESHLRGAFNDGG